MEDLNNIDIINNLIGGKRGGVGLNFDNLAATVRARARRQGISPRQVSETFPPIPRNYNDDENTPLALREKSMKPNLSRQMSVPSVPSVPSKPSPPLTPHPPSKPRSPLTPHPPNVPNPHKNKTGGYNKDTYIGYLKIKNGGMKIVDGTEDEEIIEERNIILKHLVEIINDTLPLVNEYIILYAKALEGKYIRNHICKLSENDCKNEIDTVIKISKKLLKKAIKLKMYNVLYIFNENAPKLSIGLKKYIKKLIKKYKITHEKLEEYPEELKNTEYSEELKNSEEPEEPEELKKYELNGGATINNLRKRLNRRELISQNNLYSDEELSTMSLSDKKQLQLELFEKLSRCKNTIIGGSINYQYHEDRIPFNNEIELSPEIKQLHESYNEQIKGLQHKISKFSCNKPNLNKSMNGGSIKCLNNLRMDINRRDDINEYHKYTNLDSMSLVDKRNLQLNLIDKLSRHNNKQIGGSINYNYVEENVQPIIELSPEIKQLHLSYNNQIIGLQNEISKYI